MAHPTYFGKPPFQMYPYDQLSKTQPVSQPNYPVQNHLWNNATITPAPIPNVSFSQSLQSDGFYSNFQIPEMQFQPVVENVDQASVETLNKGVEFFNEKKFTLAELFLRQGLLNLQLAPEHHASDQVNALLFLYLGRTYCEMNKFEDAGQIFLNGASLENIDRQLKASLYAEAAGVFTRNHFHADAVHYFFEALKHNTCRNSKALWFFKLGKLHFKQGHLSIAQELFKTALVSAEQPLMKAHINIGLGMTYRESKMVEEAKAYFQLVAEMPDETGLNELKAFALTQTAEIKTKEAYQTLKKASEMSGLSQRTRDVIDGKLQKFDLLDRA